MINSGANDKVIIVIHLNKHLFMDQAYKYDNYFIKNKGR